MEDVAHTLIGGSRGFSPGLCLGRHEAADIAFQADRNRAQS